MGLSLLRPWRYWSYFIVIPGKEVLDMWGVYIYLCVFIYGCLYPIHVLVYIYIYIYTYEIAHGERCIANIPLASSAPLEEEL